MVPGDSSQDRFPVRHRDEVWTVLINDARLNKHQPGREMLVHLLTCDFSSPQPSATSV